MNSFALSAVIAATLAAPITDWPQYHGPSGTRAADDTIVLRAFPEGGPPVVWRRPTESGFSSFAVAGGRAVTLVRREVDGEAREVCLALDADSGAERWATPLGEASYDGGGESGARGNDGGDGPRSTPSLAGDAVYVFDAHFVLFCLAASDGAVRWRHDLLDEFDGRGLDWQNAASPLVHGENVIVAGGGEDQSFLAFDSKTGALAWKSGDERPTHATPVAAVLHGVPQVIFFAQSGLVSLSLEDGEELWRAEYPYRTSTAASPVVHGDVVYCSAGYGVGAGAFRITKADGELRAELLWQKRNDLMNHWSTPVARDGHLYGMFGFKEYGEAPLACVELATGEVAWSRDGFGPGNCILAGDTLVALSDTGELVLVEASPKAYRELARAKVLEGKCWSSPALADGQVYVRSTREGARIDLSKSTP